MFWRKKHPKKLVENSSPRSGQSNGPTESEDSEEGEELLLMRVYRSLTLRNSAQLLTNGSLLAFLAPLAQSATGLEFWVTVFLVTLFLVLVFLLSLWTSSMVNSILLSSSPYLLVVIAACILAIKPFFPMTPQIYVARTGESFSLFDPQRYISHTEPISEDAKLIAANHPAHGWLAMALSEVNDESADQSGWRAAAQWLPAVVKKRLKTEVVFLNKAQRGSSSVIALKLPEERCSHSNDLIGASYKAYDFEIGDGMHTNMTLSLKPVSRSNTGKTRLGLEFGVRSGNREQSITFEMVDRQGVAQWEDLVLFNEFDIRTAIYSSYLSELFRHDNLRDAWADYQLNLWKTVPNDRERIRLLILSIKLNNVSASGVILQAQILPELRRLDAIWTGESISSEVLANDQFLFWAAKEFIEASEIFGGIKTVNVVTTSQVSSHREGYKTSSWSSQRLDSDVTNGQAKETQDSTPQAKGQKDLGLFANRFWERRIRLEEAVGLVENANAPVTLMEEHVDDLVARGYTKLTTERSREKLPFDRLQSMLKGISREFEAKDREETIDAWLNTAGWEDLRKVLQDHESTDLIYHRKDGGQREKDSVFGSKAEKDLFSSALADEYLRRVFVAAQDPFMDVFARSESDTFAFLTTIGDILLSQKTLFDEFAVNGDRIQQYGYDSDLDEYIKFFEIATDEYHSLEKDSLIEPEVERLITEAITFASSPTVKKMMEKIGIQEELKFLEFENTFRELAKKYPDLIRQLTAFSRASSKVEFIDDSEADKWQARIEALLQILDSPQLQKLIGQEEFELSEIAESMMEAIQKSSLPDEDKELVTRFLRLEKTLECYHYWRVLSNHSDQDVSRLQKMIEAVKATRELATSFDSTFLESILKLAIDHPRSPFWTLMLYHMGLDLNATDTRNALNVAFEERELDTRGLSVSEQHLKAFIERLMLIMTESEERSIVVNRVTGTVEFSPPFPALEEWIRSVSMAEGDESQGGVFPHIADALLLDLILQTMKDETVVGYRATPLGLPRKIFEQVTGQPIERYLEGTLGELRPTESVPVNIKDAGLPNLIISKINISGNTKTKESFIRKELEIAGLREGVTFELENFQSAVTELRDMKFFADVSARARLDSDQNGIAVEIRVEEQKTGSINFGLGHSSLREEVVLFVKLAESNFDPLNYPNFNGGGISFSAELEMAETSSHLDIRVGSRNFFGSPLEIEFPSHAASRISNEDNSAKLENPSTVAPPLNQ